MTVPDTSVSVVIPCRNGEAFLGATLESVLAQSHRPSDVVVVDDRSTDRSHDIARGYGPAVAVVSNPGVGASAARTFGTTVTRSTFVQYLDADDLLPPDALRARVEALSSAGADVAVSDWERLRNINGRWEPYKLESGALRADGISADVQIVEGFWAPPAAVLYRRSLCERIGPWREDLPVIQDARFLFDAAYRGGAFVHVAGVGAQYRQHDGGSLSTENARRFWTDILKNARDVEQMWIRDGRADERRRSAVAGVYAMVARVGFARDEQLFRAGLAELRRFPGYSPTRLVRAAKVLTRIAGYRRARLLLDRFCAAS